MSNKETHIKLADKLKIYKGIPFLLEEDAIELTEHFNRKNRKINNDTEYLLSDNKKEFYSVTRDKNGNRESWCGDFICKVVTADYLKQAIEQNNDTMDSVKLYADTLY